MRVTLLEKMFRRWKPSWEKRRWRQMICYTWNSYRSLRKILSRKAATKIARSLNRWTLAGSFCESSPRRCLSESQPAPSRNSIREIPVIKSFYFSRLMHKLILMELRVQIRFIFSSTLKHSCICKKDRCNVIREWLKRIVKRCIHYQIIKKKRKN